MGSIRRDLRSFAYFVLIRLIGVLTGRGSVSQLQLENAVLRHQVRVLRRSVRRPELKERDRALLASASRALSRDRWASFIVTPQTLLRVAPRARQTEVGLPSAMPRPAAPRSRDG